MNKAVVRIRTLWMMTGIWIVGDIISFLIGWADLRSTVSGSLHLLFFTAAVHVVTHIMEEGD